MTNLANTGRRFTHMLGIAAALLLAMSVSQRAEALSPISPIASPAAKVASDALIAVRGGHGGGGHMGGGHMGGGHIAGGGHWAGHVGGGGVFHGGGALHHGGVHVGAPLAFHHHHFGRRFYGYSPSYYSDYYYVPHRHCRLVWTYYGPRRICHYRPWRHHWHRHHRHHHWRHYY